MLLIGLLFEFLVVFLFIIDLFFLATMNYVKLSLLYTAIIIESVKNNPNDN